MSGPDLSQRLRAQPFHTAIDGSVALTDHLLKAGLSCEVSDSFTPVVATEDRVCWVSVPAGVIVVAVRWYLRYHLSYRDVEELLVERGVEVDHVAVYRWVQPCTPLLVDAARFARRWPGDRWLVDETYVKVNGVWR